MGVLISVALVKVCGPVRELVLLVRLIVAGVCFLLLVVIVHIIL